MWEKFEAALASNGLVELVEEIKNEGSSQLEIYDRFDQFRAMLRSADREADEECVMDIMDCIVGLCSPGALLFPTGLSNEEIRLYRNAKSKDKDL